MQEVGLCVSATEDDGKKVTYSRRGILVAGGRILAWFNKPRRDV